MKLTPIIEFIICLSSVSMLVKKKGDSNLIKRIKLIIITSCHEPV